jgi:hypothetical protein
VARSRSVAYYISAHGYGHGVRSCCIIRALNELSPDISVHLVTELPQSFLSSHIGSDRNPVRASSFDVGMVQLDSIRVDVDATLSKVEGICLHRKELISREAGYLRDTNIDVVVADIPGIPLGAAARLKIPCLAVGNFGWDWIYSEFAALDQRWQSGVDVFREDYSKADLLLRLPFCEEMTAFSSIEDIPLVARPGKNRRSRIAELTGCDPGKKWILLSFTTLDWNEDALTRVEKITDYEFFTVLPLAWQRSNIHALGREHAVFSDVVASVDAVISKPGFGILSDCIVNRKPLIYADRVNFLEYPILEASIKRYIRNVHIPAASLYRGDIIDSLNTIWSRPDPPETLPAGGDVIAARRIAGI